MDLTRVLARVQKPARYTGGEWRASRKEWRADQVKVALAFPDVYEVGMSHLGSQILYHVVNQREDALMERVFAPWPDMEEALRKESLPLYTLESLKPIREFDVLAFTLQYEMTFTNILTILDLAGFPLESAARNEEFPLVIAGGPCVFNPEPLADFIDVFVLGEGEEVIGEIIQAFQQVKSLSRTEQLRRLAQIEGVYVPRFYEVEYSEQGTISKWVSREANLPLSIRKRLLPDLNQAPFPVSVPVPSTEVIHDRVMLEVLRGCTRGCRFCQAGVIYRPAREKKAVNLVRQAEELIANTGYDEVSLTSLSTADHSQLQEMVREMLGKLEPKGVNISLPSLRVDAFSVDLAKEIQRVRRSTLTFAPEAGTQRLRDIINKNVTEENLMTAVEAAFAAGWKAIKLYFMIGLPGETQEDLDGIADLALKVLRIGQKHKVGKHLKVTLSISSLVPKAHTAFQWEPQNSLAELQSKQRYLRDKLRFEKRIALNYHDAQISLIEAVLARGDRRLGAVIAKAWQLGARFDGWSEWFDFAVWEEAFAANQLHYADYAQRKFAYEDHLPWEHMNSGVQKKYLILENQRSRKGITTGDCRNGKCSGCGLCPTWGVKPLIAGKEENHEPVWTVLP
ncbi:MAG: TIGR03960 family B12-binding radical SAM protein [Clostridia bacterium]|nr:TIGR03960 family B12-binding radical SAM protein [Clostridia bacterium]